MAARNYEKIMEHIFEFEGGYVDHPRDPGGATNMGITRKTLSAWRGGSVSKQQVRDLTKQEARAIYRKRYWDYVRGDDLPAGVDAIVMDAAVNSGPARAAKWLQSELGVSADGVIGPVTLAAAENHPHPAKLVAKALDRRERFLRSLRTFPTFGKGWMRRLDALEVLAQELVHRVGVTPPAEAADTRRVRTQKGRTGLLQLLLRLFR